MIEGRLIHRGTIEYEYRSAEYEYEYEYECECLFESGSHGQNLFIDSFCLSPVDRRTKHDSSSPRGAGQAWKFRQGFDPVRLVTVIEPAADPDDHARM
ncbi:MAG: hypothetical protein A2W31_02690 [Planctomycetes bacterium RBG_16_64_10]|nr:MAG: hypothetical protein A2W31_02690 [Planctomycetes bacterium RBG_16_64_10]